MITLTQISRSLKVSPKTARRRLRNARNVPKTINSKHWAWLPKQRAAVVAIIKG